MTAETHAPTIAEQLRAALDKARCHGNGHAPYDAVPPGHCAECCFGTLWQATDADDLALLRAADAAADELDRARPIVDAVLARYRHRANYPLAADFLSIEAYEAATERWRIDDHNLDRAITRAAEAHLATTTAVSTLTDDGARS